MLAPVAHKFLVPMSHRGWSPGSQRLFHSMPSTSSSTIQSLNNYRWGSAYPVDVTSTSAKTELRCNQLTSYRSLGHSCHISWRHTSFTTQPQTFCKSPLSCPHPKESACQPATCFLGSSGFYYFSICPESLNPENWFLFCICNSCEFPLPESVKNMYTLREYFPPSVAAIRSSSFHEYS